MPEVIERRRCNLVLHCGASKVERSEVAEVKTPRATETWVPVSHLQLIETVESALRSTGLEIAQQVHSLSRSGDRYFGLTEIRGKQTEPDYAWVLGLRNSHDKCYPAGIVAGASVFVCDNLSFSGEVSLSRKHTVHLLRDLPTLAAQAVGRLMERWHHQDQRIRAYKHHSINDSMAHDLVIRAVDLGACCNRSIPSILKEWREPRYVDFENRTAWSLFNAFTEELKGNLPELPKRTEVLHALFDSAVDLPSPYRN